MPFSSIAKYNPFQNQNDMIYANSFPKQVTRGAYGKPAIDKLRSLDTAHMPTHQGASPAGPQEEAVGNKALELGRESIGKHEFIFGCTESELFEEEAKAAPAKLSNFSGTRKIDPRGPGSSGDSPVRKTEFIDISARSPPHNAKKCCLVISPDNKFRKAWDLFQVDIPD